MPQDLLELRKQQTATIATTRTRGSASARLEPYRDQIGILLKQPLQPSVRQLHEILEKAGVKVSRPSLTAYLKREFNWESPQKRGKKEEATPPNKKTTPKSEDNGSNKPTEKPSPKRSASVDTSAIEAALSANMSHRSKTNE